MGNFNPGVGTGMNSELKKSSSFKRDDKNVANNPDAKSPEEGGNVEKLTFDQAFRRARAQGKETFTWEGKSYTTKLKGDEKTEASQDKSEPKSTTKETKPEEGNRKRLIEKLMNLAKMHPTIRGIDLAAKSAVWLTNKIKELTTSAATTGIGETASERITKK